MFCRCLYSRYLLFTRRKISFFVIPLLLVSAVFIIYQITIFLQISSDLSFNNKPNMIVLIRGTHERQSKFYEADRDNKFTCIRSLEQIDFKRVNDDYCDCLDGSDEPGTNACGNGIFFCASQTTGRDTKSFSKSVSSSKVNDGICDCCDGSDEWKIDRLLTNFDRNFQKLVIVTTPHAQTIVERAVP